MQLRSLLLSNSAYGRTQRTDRQTNKHTNTTKNIILLANLFFAMNASLPSILIGPKLLNYKKSKDKICLKSILFFDAILWCIIHKIMILEIMLWYHHFTSKALRNRINRFSLFNSYRQFHQTDSHTVCVDMMTGSPANTTSFIFIFPFRIVQTRIIQTLSSKFQTKGD